MPVDKQKFLREHLDPAGRLRPDLWRKGMEHAKQMPTVPNIGSYVTPPRDRESRVSQPSTVAMLIPEFGSGLFGSQWKQIGPAPILDTGKGQISAAGGTLSGLVTDIAIDPSGAADTNIYIATDAGGIWKSVDGGKSWTPKTDFMPAISMGAVALDPNNPAVVYAGSGSWANFGDFNGAGVYRSTDGGDNWQVLNPSGILSNVGINRIVLPDSKTLLVGTAAGLFRLTVDGAGFTLVLAGVITDLKLDTGARNIVYAAVAGSGIFKSTDGGTSFARASFFSTTSKGLPQGLAFGGIVFAQSTRPDGNTFYASAILTAGQPLLFCGGPVPNPTVGVYKSTDGAQNWSEIKQGPELPASLQTIIVGNQTIGYDLTLGVDPQNANIFYYGLRGLYAATDGGAAGLRDKTASQPFPCPSKAQDNRIDLPKGHSDQHAITFSPPGHFDGTPTRVFLGSDGGLISSADLGSTYSYLNGSLATILMNWFDIGRGGKGNNQFSYGTAQDNGLFSHTPAQSGPEWIEGSDSDGTAVAVDPLDAAHALGADNISFYTTTDGQNWTPNSQLPAGIRPIVFDPNGQKAYAASGQKLFQSKDNGATFSLMKTFAQGITTIGQSKIDSNTIWIGFADGTLQSSTNVLTGNPPTWSAPLNQPVAIRGQGVASVAVDARNASRVVAVYGGFSNVDPLTTPSRHVFMTTNAGATWSDISGVSQGGVNNLPDLPVYSVVIDTNTSPEAIIVAGDGGVFQSADQGQTWQRLGSGLPNAQMIMLALDSSVSPELLRVGSWGRSAFQLLIPIAGVTGDPVLIQSNWGRQGNFELLVPQGNVVGQYFRNNDDSTFPWHFLRDFGYPVPPGQLGPAPVGLTFLQSNFMGDGVHGNFEVIVRVAPPIATQPQHLDFWFLDSKTSKWNGPFPLTADGQAIDGVTGDPVLIQSNWGKQGNFELLVPHGNVIRQYFRNNDDPTFPWHFLREFGYPVPPGQLGPMPVGLTFRQSNFLGDGVHGNFEVIVRVAPPIATQPPSLDFWFLDSKTSKWNGPFPLLAD